MAWGDGHADGAAVERLWRADGLAWVGRASRVGIGGSSLNGSLACMRHQYLCWPGLPDAWRRCVGDWRVRFRDGHPTHTLEVLRILPRGQAYCEARDVTMIAGRH